MCPGVLIADDPLDGSKVENIPGTRISDVLPDRDTRKIESVLPG